MAIRPTRTMNWPATTMAVRDRDAAADRCASWSRAFSWATAARLSSAQRRRTSEYVRSASASSCRSCWSCCSMWANFSCSSFNFCSASTALCFQCDVMSPSATGVSGLAQAAAPGSRPSSASGSACTAATTILLDFALCMEARRANSAERLACDAAGLALTAAVDVAIVPGRAMRPPRSRSLRAPIRVRRAVVNPVTAAPSATTTRPSTATNQRRTKRQLTIATGFETHFGREPH